MHFLKIPLGIINFMSVSVSQSCSSSLNFYMNTISTKAV